MSKHDENFVIITDLDSVERMLSNAEIDFDSSTIRGATTITTDIGVVFKFSDDGTLEVMRVNE